MSTIIQRVFQRLQVWNIIFQHLFQHLSQLFQHLFQLFQQNVFQLFIFQRIKSARFTVSEALRASSSSSLAGWGHRRAGALPAPYAF